MDDQKQLSEIIAREFRRRASFPISAEIEVIFLPDDEAVRVNVGGMNFVMLCGSDDDCFLFQCEDSTIPPVIFPYPGGTG